MSLSKISSVSGLLLQVDFCACSVILYIGNDRMLCKNGRLDRDAVWGGVSGMPKEHGDWGPDPTR